MSSVLSELVRKKLVSREQFEDVQLKRITDKRSLQDLMIGSGYLAEETLFKTARKMGNYPVIDLTRAAIDPEVIKLIPYARALHHSAFPVRKDDDSIVVAMSDPFDLMARDELCFLTHRDIKPMLSRQSQIMTFIKKYYASDFTIEEMLKNTIEYIQSEPSDILEVSKHDEIVDLALIEGDLSSVVRFANKIISDAVDMRASDIHIEPREQAVEIRYRIDGHLRPIITIPRQLHQRMAARIKILAKLDIAEQRKPQDGRLKIKVKDNKIDLRISVIPLVHGEKIVLRVLDGNSTQFDLNNIGFQEKELEIFKEGIQRPQGVVLVTGPTGAGKTTTLYSALQHIKCETKNIVTIEDPIEYLVEGINQVQLNRFKDVTFANGLRSILRQDPDTILVGEIRDRETADIAFRASLTGHLVFSTLHTNSATATITRLLDIGLEPYLIASSTIFFVAQRLVGLNCLHCRKEYQPEKKLLAGFKPHLRKNPIKKFYRGKGCVKCDHTGFYGRTSIFEILKVDETIRDLILMKAPERQILKEAMKRGMTTLVDAGLVKVNSGLTTLEEVGKVTDLLQEHGAASAKPQSSPKNSA